MKSTILAALVCATLAGGCSPRSWATLTGNAQKTCVDGVTYLQFESGATVQLDRNGKPVPCK